MDYDEDIYRELAMSVLEHDIDWIASRYWIPGYDIDDLKQELRLELWRKIKLFDHTKEIKLRSWANTVMRNHMRRLLRDANRKKRGGDCEFVDFDKVKWVSIDNSDGLIEFLDKIHENGFDLDDFI